MNHYLNSLFEIMSRYISDFVGAGYRQAWFLSSIFIMIYVLSLIRLKTLNNRIDPPKLFTHKFFIFRNLIISSIITNVFIIAVAGILWANSKLLNIKFLIILAVIISTGITVILFAVFRNHFVEKYPSPLIRQTFTQNEFNRLQKQAIGEFTRLKYFTALLPVALLAGFLNFSGQSSLICFVVDNSHSNSEYFHLGKAVLGEKLQELNSENHLILSWFLDQPPTESISEIVQAVNYGYLAASNQFFTSSENAATQLNAVPLTAGAPLCESIWANYLFSKEKDLDHPYQNKLLVILTRGEGNLTSNEMDCFLCCQDEFTNFFDTVALVNLGGRDTNVLSRQISNCNHPVVQDAGLSRPSISRALDEILTEYKTDRFFMPWTAIFVFIFWTVILFLQPKKG